MTVHAPHWPRPQPNLGPLSAELVAQYIKERSGLIEIHGLLAAVYS